MDDIGSDRDLNRCNFSHLMRIPLVTSQLANDILSFRRQLRGYTSVDQLNVIGMSPKIFHILKEHFINIGTFTPENMIFTIGQLCYEDESKRLQSMGIFEKNSYQDDSDASGNEDDVSSIICSRSIPSYKRTNDTLIATVESGIHNAIDHFELYNNKIVAISLNRNNNNEDSSAKVETKVPRSPSRIAADEKMYRYTHNPAYNVMSTPDEAQLKENQRIKERMNESALREHRKHNNDHKNYTQGLYSGPVFDSNMVDELLYSPVEDEAEEESKTSEEIPNDESRKTYTRVVTITRNSLNEENVHVHTTESTDNEEDIIREISINSWIDTVNDELGLNQELVKNGKKIKKKHACIYINNYKDTVPLNNNTRNTNNRTNQKPTQNFQPHTNVPTANIIPNNKPRFSSNRTQKANPVTLPTNTAPNPAPMGNRPTYANICFNNRNPNQSYRYANIYSENIGMPSYAYAPVPNNYTPSTFNALPNTMAYGSGALQNAYPVGNNYTPIPPGYNMNYATPTYPTIPGIPYNNYIIPNTTPMAYLPTSTNMRFNNARFANNTNINRVNNNNNNIPNMNFNNDSTNNPPAQQ